VAQQVSTRRGIGHHWAPVAAVLDKGIRSLLSDEAVEYAMGAYSVPTDPSHRNGTFGGLTHPQYNNLVKKELKKFIQHHKIEKMQQFIGQINNGLDAFGEPYPAIAEFNE
jgi:hypothetical protein